MGKALGCKFGAVGIDDARLWVVGVFNTDDGVEGLALVVGGDIVIVDKLSHDVPELRRSLVLVLRPISKYYILVIIVVVLVVVLTRSDAQAQAEYQCSQEQKIIIPLHNQSVFVINNIIFPFLVWLKETRSSYTTDAKLANNF